MLHLEQITCVRPLKPLIQVSDLQVAYGPTAVVRGVSLGVPAGQTLAILGQSGCGKTTLLKAIAGLIVPQSGQIHIGGQLLQALPLRERGVVYLDQEPLLLDHLSVLGNVALAPRLHGQSRAAANRDAQAMLRAVQLEVHGEKRPWQLSGGQKQRIAFARAILARPRLLLLDEPFGSLDGPTRREMQELMRSLFAEHRITAIFVTHDLREALTVGEHFALMEQGRLHLYRDRTHFVSDSATGIPQEIEFWSQTADLNVKPL